MKGYYTKKALIGEYRILQIVRGGKVSRFSRIDQLTAKLFQ